MTHPSLFGDGRYGLLPGHARGSDTSAEAAAAISPTLRARQRMVLRALVELGRATADDLCAELGLPRNSVAPRLTEMKRMNPPLVWDTGERRATPTGARAAVYAATVHGMREAR